MAISTAINAAFDLGQFQNQKQAFEKVISPNLAEIKEYFVKNDSNNCEYFLEKLLDHIMLEAQHGRVNFSLLNLRKRK